MPQRPRCTAGRGAESPPRSATRVAVAAIIGAAAGIALYVLMTRVDTYRRPDFAIIWEGARAIAAHENPYTVVRGEMGVLANRPIFFYPLPMAVLLLPLTPLSAPAAGAIFIGLSCALLAFAATTMAWWPLWMFASASAINTIALGQTSALITAGILLPAFSWIGVIKPNFGIAILARRPSVTTAGVMLAIALATLCVMPTWPLEWLRAVRASSFHLAPIRTPGGVLLLIALARWRRPEARLLLALSVLPSSPIAYDMLALFSIPQSRREMMVVCILSGVMWLATNPISFLLEPERYFARTSVAALWLMYVPALVMVLRRPNVGAISNG